MVKDAAPTTIPELEAAIKRADDKERLVGLLLAPVAGAIALLVVASLVAHDPKAIVNGQIDKLHVNPSLYLELGAVTLALALLMLGAAWLRKRICHGDRHGSLRALHLQPPLLGLRIPVHPGRGLVPGSRLPAVGEAQAARLDQPGAAGGGAAAPPPQASKRYTPPTAPIRRAPKPKPGKELEAG